MGAQIHDGKLTHIQLMRALSGLIVVVSHVGWGFASHVGPGLGFELGANLPGNAAIMVFFLISGYIMVVSSGPLFGDPQARRIFWVRRIIRAMPPYWIATILFVIVMLVLQGQWFGTEKIAKSIALIPYWPDGVGGGGGKPLPVLWPGWTLYYEMVFYMLFGVMIAQGRIAAMAFTGAACLALSLVGLTMRFESPVLHTFTQPIFLLFIVGMALGWLAVSGRRLPAWFRIACAAAFVPATVFAVPPDPGVGYGVDYLRWCALPAILLFTAIVGGPLRLPFPRFITLAGDSSYAVYLLHVPIAWIAMWVFGQLRFYGGPWAYFALAFAMVYGLSWLFFRHVERPMTRWLNRQFAVDAKRARLEPRLADAT
ncbi:acyltransferase [Erythrobacter sp. JK5]|uniref:acyltransferase family protein n=1 Tax=Erythrobacter sp. JK5 TaxID=2829500 RepID=UPI001BA7879F|nr:acyltransferase [Erythrobacter sp. JK5]QUL36727.1 acyltransferase [Erythrobacter sp. JK5]